MSPAAPPTSKPTHAKPHLKKLPKLPPAARVTKRPLHRPALPSPYTNSKQPKVVYISTSTPFLSAVKRVEKLLRLADKRLVQAATTRSKQNGPAARKGWKGRKGDAGRGGGEDEVLGIAEEVERLKEEGRRKKGGKGGAVDEDGDGHDAAGEEVLVKGTGRAIAKVLDLAGWFQQRGDVYVVRLRTGSVGAVDDVEIDESKILSTGGEGEEMDVDSAEPGTTKKKQIKPGDEEMTALPQTRIRQTSVLEVAVSLR